MLQEKELETVIYAPPCLRVPKRNKKICTVGFGQPVLFDRGHRFDIQMAPADLESQNP